MRKYEIIVIERSESKFVIEAEDEDEVKSLIYKFYNGFDEDVEIDRA